MGASSTNTNQTVSRPRLCPRPLRLPTAAACRPDRLLSPRAPQIQPRSGAKGAWHHPVTSHQANRRHCCERRYQASAGHHGEIQRCDPCPRLLTKTGMMVLTTKATTNTVSHSKRAWGRRLSRALPERSGATFKTWQPLRPVGGPRKTLSTLFARARDSSRGHRLPVCLPSQTFHSSPLQPMVPRLRTPKPSKLQPSVDRAVATPDHPRAPAVDRRGRLGEAPMREGSPCRCTMTQTPLHLKTLPPP